MLNDNDAWGNNKKFLKTTLKITFKMQNTRFSWLKQVANKLPGQVARHRRWNFWKICLSVFRDWKFHPRGSHEGSRKHFCVTLTIRAFTHEQVANLSREKPKNPDFLKKFLSIFHDWDNDVPVSCENLLYELATGDMRLDWLATKSLEQGNTVFENFVTFCKNKILSKNN